MNDGRAHRNGNKLNDEATPLITAKKRIEWRRKVSQLYILFILVVQSINISIVLPTLPGYIHSIDGPSWLLGLITASANLGAILSNPLFGVWSTYRSMREALACSLVLFVVGNFFYSDIDTQWVLSNRGIAPYMLIVARFTTGLAQGNTGMLQGYMSLSSPKDKRATAMGLFSACELIGYIAGAGIGGLITLLPDVNVAHGILEFNMLTYPGYLSAVLGIVALAGIFLLSIEAIDQAEDEDSSSEEEGEVDSSSRTSSSNGDGDEESDSSSSSSSSSSEDEGDDDDDEEDAKSCCCNWAYRLPQVLIIVIYFLGTSVYNAVSTVSVPWMIQQLRLGDLANGLLWTASGAVGVVADLVVAKYGHRVSNRALLYWVLSLQVCGVLLMVRPQWIPWDGTKHDNTGYLLQYVAGLVVFDVSFTLLELVAVTVFSTKVKTKHQTRMFSWLQAVGWNSSALLAPLWGMFVFSAVGGNMLFVVCGAVCLVNLAIPLAGHRLLFQPSPVGGTSRPSLYRNPYTRSESELLGSLQARHGVFHLPTGRRAKSLESVHDYLDLRRKRILKGVTGLREFGGVMRFGRHWRRIVELKKNFNRIEQSRKAILAMAQKRKHRKTRPISINSVARAKSTPHLARLHRSHHDANNSPPPPSLPLPSLGSDDLEPASWDGPSISLE